MSECKTIQELISRMLDEDLSASEQARLHAHVQSCDECRRLLDAFTMVHDTLQEDLQDPPAELAESVMEQIRREPVSITKKRRKVIGRYVALAACLAVVAFSAYRFDLFKGKGSASMMKDAAMPAEAPALEKAEAVSDELIAGSMILSLAASGDAAVPESITEAESPALQEEAGFADVYAANEPSEATGIRANVLTFIGAEYAFLEITDTLPEPEEAPQSPAATAAPSAAAATESDYKYSFSNNTLVSSKDTDEENSLTVRIVGDLLCIQREDGLWEIYKRQ